MISTFGEIMLRVSPANKGERISQALQYRIEPGGSESNVAIALSNLGCETKVVTKLPDNELSKKILLYLSQFSIDIKDIILIGSKLGIYWTENGIGPRSSFVIYDRMNSSFSEAKFSDFNWNNILAASEWFHFSGISPAISKNVYKTILSILKLNDNNYHIPVSIDLNFRNNLWKWIDNDKEKIYETMKELCSFSSLICGNETDFQNCLNFRSNKNDENEFYSEIVDQCFNNFHNLKYVAISNRNSYSASINDWNGFLFRKDVKNMLYKSKGCTITDIVDRVGTGDSFVAGIIYGLNHLDEMTYQEVIDFAITLSALNHTIVDDASRFSYEDVTRAIKSNLSGRIIR